MKEVRLKIFQRECFLPGKGDISYEDDIKLTEKRINKFCNGKKIINIKIFDSEIVIIYEK